jgi:hypothetical protein
MRDINRKAPVVCSRSIEINAPVAVVWNLITGIDAWSQWQRGIRNPSIKGALAVGSVFTWTTGGTKIASTIHTVEPLSAFGWTGKTFGATAIHNWMISSHGSVTTVSVDESMEGFLVSLFKKSFQRNLAKVMDTWLALLKAQAEKSL